MQEYITVSLQWNGHFGIATRNHRGQWHIANASFATQPEALAYIEHQQAYEMQLWAKGKHPAQLAALALRAGIATSDTPASSADAELEALTAAMAQGALLAARQWAMARLGDTARARDILESANGNDGETLGYMADEVRDYARGILEHADLAADYALTTTR